MLLHYQVMIKMGYQGIERDKLLRSGLRRSESKDSKGQKEGATGVSLSVAADGGAPTSQTRTSTSAFVAVAGSTATSSSAASSSSMSLAGMQHWQTAVSGFLRGLEEDLSHFNAESGIGQLHLATPTAVQELTAEEENLATQALEGRVELGCRIGEQKAETRAVKDAMQEAEETKKKKKKKKKKTKQADTQDGGQTKRRKRLAASKKRKHVVHHKPASFIKDLAQSKDEEIQGELPDGDGEADGEEACELESMEPPDEEDERQKGLKMDLRNRKSRAYHMAYDKMMRKGLPLHDCQEAGRRCSAKIT